jgi:hypothetical protein
VDYSLIVIVNLILFLCELVFLKCDDESMSRFRWRLQITIFGFVNSVNQGKLVVPLLGLLPSPGVESSRLLDIRLSQDELVEPIDSLPLISGRFELTRIKSDGVMRAA